MIFPEADRLIPLLGVQCCTALLKMQKATNLFFQHKWVGGVGCFFPLPRPTAGACTGQRLGMSLILTFYVGWVECAEAACAEEFSRDSCFYEPF